GNQGSPSAEGRGNQGSPSAEGRGNDGPEEQTRWAGGEEVPLPAAIVEKSPVSEARQRGQLAAGMQVPQARAVFHGQGQQAAVGADVALVVTALAGAQAADQGAVLAARGDFQQLCVLFPLAGGPQPPAVAAEPRKDEERQLHQLPARPWMPQPQHAVP